MTVKAGYRTSEFWFTLVSFLFSGLYLTGLLKENEQKEELITVVSHAVESVILISGQVWILAKYIKGRTEVKKIVEQNKSVEMPTPTPQPPSPQEETLNDSKRTNSGTSRKNNTRTKSKPKKSKKRSAKWSMESATISSSQYCTNNRGHS